MTEEQSRAERTASPETVLSNIFEVMDLPIPWDERQMRCIALAERLSSEQKLEAFAQLQNTLTPEEKEMLSALKNASDLLGSNGAAVQKQIGDVVFDKIMDQVIIARLKNQPSETDGGHEYTFSEPQLEKLRTALASLPLDIQQTVWPIMVDPAFLNSPVLQLRERTKFLFSVIRVIQQYFEKPENVALVTESQTDQISKLRVETTNLIGYMNNLKFR